VWEGKDLAGLADISYDIIPSGYSLSRDILVPFWERKKKINGYRDAECAEIRRESSRVKLL
jgi:hypothetical protein